MAEQASVGPAIASAVSYGVAPAGDELAAAAAPLIAGKPYVVRLLRFETGAVSRDGSSVPVAAGGCASFVP